MYAPPYTCTHTQKRKMSACESADNTDVFLVWSERTDELQHQVSVYFPSVRIVWSQRKRTLTAGSILNNWRWFSESRLYAAYGYFLLAGVLLWALRCKEHHSATSTNISHVQEIRLKFWFNVSEGGADLCWSECMASKETAWILYEV